MQLTDVTGQKWKLSRAGCDIQLTSGRLLLTEKEDTESQQNFAMGYKQKSLTFINFTRSLQNIFQRAKLNKRAHNLPQRNKKLMNLRYIQYHYKGFLAPLASATETIPAGLLKMTCEPKPILRQIRYQRWC
jgi:hypothetical protein